MILRRGHRNFQGGDVSKSFNAKTRRRNRLRSQILHDFILRIGQPEEAGGAADRIG